MDAPSAPLYPLRGAARLSYYVQRLIARWGGVQFCDYQLIAQPRDAMPAMPKGYQVIRAQDSELRALRQAFPLSTATLRWRRSQNMEALLAKRGEVAVGLIWVSAERFEEDEAPLRFHLPPHSAWDTGLYIPPRERHRRAWAALWAGVAQWMQMRDLQCCYSRINRANAASLAGHQRMGAHRLGRLCLFQWRDWLWMPTHHLLPRHQKRRPRLDIHLPAL